MKERKPSSQIEGGKKIPAKKLELQQGEKVVIAGIAGKYDVLCKVSGEKVIFSARDHDPQKTEAGVIKKGDSQNYFIQVSTHIISRGKPFLSLKISFKTFTCLSVKKPSTEGFSCYVVNIYGNDKPIHSASVTLEDLLKQNVKGK